MGETEKTVKGIQAPAAVEPAGPAVHAQFSAGDGQLFFDAKA